MGTNPVPDNLALLPSDVPDELPALAPAVVVVTHPTGHLYLVFENEPEARLYWETARCVPPGQRAFLFVRAELVAFAANL
jgi:hypothetical protein